MITEPAATLSDYGLAIIEGGSHAEALFRDDPEGFVGLIRPWWAKTLGTVSS